ncbi:MAG: ABC transporter substrate-binding protein [Planctomycetes bacterium]|nr:ABC transporter substrate-binding protein [Planctomycetota bacterium]
MSRFCVVLIALLAGAGGCSRKEGRRVVRFLDQPDSGGAWKEIIARFEAAHPGVHVELVEGPPATNVREDMYATSFLSGDGTYDLAYMDVIWVSKFAAQGWLRPLDDRLPPAARADFFPGDIEGATWQGRLYRVPMRSDAGMLYYRTDLVKKPPETFEELAAAARELQKPPGLWGFVFQGRQYEGLVCAFLEVLRGFGGDVLDEKGEVALDRPEAVRALEWFAGTVKTISPEGVTTYQEEEARHAFQEGRAVFMRNWPYAWSRLQQEGSAVRGKVGIVPMVHAPGCASSATLGGWGFGISSSARYPEEAWAFIEFATRPEQQRLFHFRNGAVPARRSLFEDPEILKESPHYPELRRILQAARPRPVHPRYPQISDAFQSHLSAALVGREAPAEALRRAAEKIRAVLRK